MPRRRGRKKTEEEILLWKKQRVERKKTEAKAKKRQRRYGRLDDFPWLTVKGVLRKLNPNIILFWANDHTIKHKVSTWLNILDHRTLNRKSCIDTELWRNNGISVTVFNSRPSSYSLLNEWVPGKEKLNT